MSDKTENPDKLKVIRMVFNAAEEIAGDPPAPDDASEPVADAGGSPPPADAGPSIPTDDKPAPPRPPIKYRADGLPEGCPVTPLGINDDVFYYLDASNQLRALKARDHSRLGVQGLFGIFIGKLYDFWPRIDKDGFVVGWKPEKAAENLMRAAAKRGVWNAFDRVRGAGAWLGGDAQLVLHCGDAVWVGPAPGKPGNGTWEKPGLIGRHVYPADAPSPRPSPTPAAAGDGGPADELLQIFKTWNWRRPEIDPRLMLGGEGAAMIGGALDWRPARWMTGGPGTGKSTLQKAVTRLHDGALITVSDASAAGVWQKLGHRSLPVQIDELEAEEDNRKSNNLVKLARQAASGGLVLRGGSDHSSAEFQARSCFLFSSVNIPPLEAQDRSRMAILELGKLGNVAAPPLEPAIMRTLGAQLRRRLVDGWHRFPTTLEKYRDALMAVGHSARGADQYGTLLAIADVLLLDIETDTDSAEMWAAKLAPAELSEVGDTETDQARCAAFLLTTTIDVFRNGERKTIAEWICDAADIRNEHGNGLAPNIDEAKRVLGTYGIKVESGAGGVLWVAVANYHQGLAGIFERTHWAGRAGTMGGWVQAWRRIEGARVPKKTMNFGGHRGRCVAVPLASLMPDHAKPASVTAWSDPEIDDAEPSP
jgi:hypothetical protein